MPVIDAGTGGRGDRVGGEMRVVPHLVADDTIKGQDGRPPALKVVFKSAVSDETASYAIPIGQEYAAEATARLAPFTEGAPSSFTEKGLRQFVNGNSLDGPFWVRTWGDYIQAFQADVGDHDGYLDNLRMTKKGDRVWFTLRDERGFTSDFSAPWPPIATTVGKTPAEDSIGGVDENGKKAFSPNKGPFPYLVQFGLDWKRFALEEGELESAPALWPGHYTPDGVPMLSYMEQGAGEYPPGHDAWCYFNSTDDLCPELLDATKRHGLKMVSWTVVMDEKYGLSVERGDYFFKLTPVKIKESPPTMSAADAAFEKEAILFRELYDNLTKVIMNSAEATFLRGDTLTDEGRKVAKTVLVPLVNTYPNATLARKEDGTPAVGIPPTPKEWVLDGLVCANLTAERLFKAGLDLTDPFGIMDANDNTKLLAWVAENVPEWTGAGKKEGSELL